MLETPPPTPPPASRFRRWRSRLIPYGILYLILLASIYCFNLTDRLVLMPTTRPIRVAMAERRLVTVPAGKVEVLVARSRAAAATGPSAFVLEFTGNATRAEMIAENAAWEWQHHPVDVWAVNYPGYGNSTGPARLQAIADTSLAVYDELRRDAGDRPIFVRGTSLGTTAALHVAANREVAGLILTNPPPLRQLIRGRFGWWNLWLAATPISLGVPADLDSIANAANTRAPAIFITSARDEVVPLAYQQRVADAYAGPKRVLLREAAGHNDGLEGSDQAWMTTQIAWLWTFTAEQPRREGSPAMPNLAQQSEPLDSSPAVH